MLLAACERDAPAPPPLQDPFLEGAERVDDLAALGYSAGVVEAGEDSGVVQNDRARAWPGLNLYVSAHGPEAILMDMDGEVLHRWERPFFDIWPRHPAKKNDPNTRYFRRAHPFPNGDLLAIFEGLGLVKLDAASRVLWKHAGQEHHDLAVVDDRVLVLTRSMFAVEHEGERRPLLKDFISVLDGRTGREQRKIDLLECLKRSEFASLWEASPLKTGDVFHTNTLHVLDGRLEERLPAFARGRVLTSFRNQSLLAVVDLEQERVVWARRGTFRHQHDPQIVGAGGLLLFDNLGAHPFSRVLELDPETLEVTWSYAGSERRPFFSMRCGTVQRLPNGNTLIVESGPGRAFEVLPDGTTVWDFRNPGRTGAEDELVARLFDVIRLPADWPLDWARAQPR